MASNIKDYEISKTFSNVILSNIDAQPDTDGIPFDLSTSPRLAQGRLQDGLGNTSPLFLSKTVVEVNVAPTTINSLVRKQEIMEAITYAQTQSLILG